MPTMSRPAPRRPFIVAALVCLTVVDGACASAGGQRGERLADTKPIARNDEITYRDSAIIPACSPAQLAAMAPPPSGLRASLAAEPGTQELSAEERRAILDAVARRRLDTDSLPAEVEFELSFVIDREAGIGDAWLLRHSPQTTFDESVVRALVSAALLGELPTPVTGKDHRVRLRISSDSTGAGWEPFPKPLQVIPDTTDRPTKIAPENTAPRYPRALLRRGVTGEVILEFLVGADGRQVPGTVTVLEIGHEQFLASVTAHLPTMRFEPAMRGGCAVPQWMTQPFLFRLGGE